MLEPNQSLDHPVFVLFYHSSTIVHKYCRILRSLNFLHHRSISACFFLCILTTMSNTPVHIYNLLLPDDLVRPFFSIYVYCFSFFKPIFIATLYLASLWPIISNSHSLTNLLFQMSILLFNHQIPKDMALEPCLLQPSAPGVKGGTSFPSTSHLSLQG